MYLNRKIDKWLNDWKAKEDKSPALIVCIRQCGKTRSVEHFGKQNYKNVVRVKLLGQS